MELGLCRSIGKALSHRAGMARKAAARHASLLAPLGAEMGRAGRNVILLAVEGVDRAGGKAGLFQARFAWALPGPLGRKIENHGEQQRRPVGVRL